MEKIKLKYKGTDDWGRPVYADKEGNLFKDTNLGTGQLVLCTTSSMGGEPDTPVSYIERYKNVEFEI